MGFPTNEANPWTLAYSRALTTLTQRCTASSSKEQKQMTRRSERKHSNCSQETEICSLEAQFLRLYVCLKKRSCYVPWYFLMDQAGRRLGTPLSASRSWGLLVSMCHHAWLPEIYNWAIWATPGARSTQGTQQQQKERRTMIIFCCFSMSVICPPDSKFTQKSKGPRSLNTISRENRGSRLHSG